MMARKLPKQWTFGECPKCGLRGLGKPRIVRAAEPGFGWKIRTCRYCHKDIRIDGGLL